MSQAARLLAAGQKFHALQFPAVIRIDGQTYDAATSGFSRVPDLVAGGWLPELKIAFWLPVAAFAAANKAVPGTEVGRSPVEVVSVNGVTPPCTEVIAGDISRDPTGTTLMLRCTSPEK